MRLGSFLVIASLIIITMTGIAHAQDKNPNCKSMQDYEKTAGMPVPQTFFRQGYEAKCFTISGNGTYITYIPNDSEIQNLQKAQVMFVSSPLHVLSDSGSAIDVTLSTGQTRDIPVKITIDNGSSLFYARLSLANMPQSVQAWMNPNVSDLFVENLNKQGAANATISVFVDSGAKAGNYDIPIIATEGTVKDSLGNETQLGKTVIGVMHLTISGHDDLWSSVGLPVDEGAQFCSKAPGGGMMCSGFIAYEQYLVTTYSSGEKQVRLSLPDMPAGKYARFIPAEIMAGPSGTASTLIVAGIVKPGIPNALYNPTVTVTATSSDGLKAVNYLQIAESQNLTVIDSPKPIDLNGNFGGDGKSGSAIFGVVYDPQNYSGDFLPVKLSVLGLDDGGKIAVMPPWLSVLIPDSSFQLKPTIPYYFTIEFVGNNASLGTYPVAIGENIGGSYFTQDVSIKIYEPVGFGGPMMQPAGSAVPEIIPQNQTNTVWLIEIIIAGLALSGGSIFGVLYFTRQ